MHGFQAEPVEVSSWLAREKGRIMIELQSLTSQRATTTAERARVESLEARLAVLDDQIDETVRANYGRRNHG
jgi:hypothetical protein